MAMVVHTSFDDLKCTCVQYGMGLGVNTKRECEWEGSSWGVHGCEAPVSWINLPLWMEVSGGMCGMGRVGEEEKKKEEKETKTPEQRRGYKKGPAKPSQLGVGGTTHTE